ncbi:hypothetical protein HDU67_003624 [Dinochytrium kinnereticum]|nr:hypothetical protein HDU67_003624 [Dinochytrium kinnereticum]
MIIKVWMQKECRRFAADPEAVTYARLRAKIRSLYGLATDDFTLKYKDHEGDLVTFGSEEELSEIFEMDLKGKDSDAVLKIYVYCKSTQALPDAGDELAGAIASASICGSRANGGLVASAGDSPVMNADAPRDPELSRIHLLEILRDISLYIATRDLDPVKTWVSSERNLIREFNCKNSSTQSNNLIVMSTTAPSDMATVAANNGPRFSKVVKTSLEKSSGAQRKPQQSSTDHLVEAQTNIKEWSAAAVEEWLQANGFADFVPACKEHDITGEVLMELTHENLREMKMNSTGRRIRLLNLISDLRG